jgi:hypothetical protein
MIHKIQQEKKSMYERIKNDAEVFVRGMFSLHHQGW